MVVWKWIGLLTASLFVCTRTQVAAASNLKGLQREPGSYYQNLLASWCQLHPGVRTYMRSTYDRSGGNEGADASHFLYQTRALSIPLDIAGDGVLLFARFNHWHGSPWMLNLDGKTETIAETSAPPRSGPPRFEGDKRFSPPLALTWNQTMGADVSWVPLPFRKNLRLGYTHTHYGTGYFIYQLFANPRHELIGPRGLATLLSKAGVDLTAGQHSLRSFRGSLALRSTRTIFAQHRSAGEIRLLQLEAPQREWRTLEHARLVIRWDQRATASVDAPIGLFFGAGSLFNRDHKEYLVKALPMNVIFRKGRILLRCFFPMPFFRSASIQVQTQGPVHLSWTIKTGALIHPRKAAYFHATYHDFPKPELGHDLVLLNTKNLEGSRFWSGQFVGTSLIFSHHAVFSGLEGDPRFFFDDSNSPQGYGTGTEEWSCGGDYWGERTTSLPLAGHPVGAPDGGNATEADDKIESSYRFLLSDLMPFGRNATICLEHGGTNESPEHYESVTYWYGLPRCTLAFTGQLKVGERSSEQAHGYLSSKSSAPYTINSRYELGVDHLYGRETFPAHREMGRVMHGSTEFTAGVRPENRGLLLRRKLDYKFADQRARVYVRRVGSRKWGFAGIWYLAGSNTCVYSNSADELGEAQHVVETSNRRFREDEFLVPANLTSGARHVRIRIVYDPVLRPLYPGGPILPHGWSEIRYRIYSFVP